MVGPYIFLYVLAILAVAMAFLLRACGDAGPNPGEVRALAIAGLLIVTFLLVKASIGGRTGGCVPDHRAGGVSAGANSLRAPIDIKSVIPAAIQQPCVCRDPPLRCC